MYEVYYLDKVVSFMSNPHAECDTMLVVRIHDRLSPAKIVENLGNSKHLCIKAEDPKKAFNDFCAQFSHVKAAGGVVDNGQGQTLMIFRHGKWDLPKGHLESGEEAEQGALREVREETGLSDISVGNLIADTLHFYRSDGVWEMKRTRWYAMNSDNSALTPQTEEGITEAAWLTRDEVRENSMNTYSSITKILRQAGKL